MSNIMALKIITIRQVYVLAKHIYKKIIQFKFLKPTKN